MVLWKGPNESRCLILSNLEKSASHFFLLWAEMASKTQRFHIYRVLLESISPFPIQIWCFSILKPPVKIQQLSATQTKNWIFYYYSSKKPYIAHFTTINITNLKISQMCLLVATNYHWFQYIQISCLKGEKSK